MQEPLPYTTCLPSTTTISSASSQSPSCDTTNSCGAPTNNFSIVQKLVSEKAVIVFGLSGCCMCHVVKLLLLGHGVNPTIFYVDEQDEAAVIHELSTISGAGERKDGGRLQFPAVFVGGELFGGLERVMATHISGELVPILKKVGALWL